MAHEPEVIGRYTVIGLLGSGGMGAVYLADDPILKRRVALKVVRGGMLEREQALARFRREAEISAALNHPNIVTIYDVGEDPALGPFLAMEHVDGRSLCDVVRSGDLDLESRLRVLVEAARALAAAHAAGVVHRDVKPANLLIGVDGRVKLMDFGIARGAESSITTAGAVLGTPSYIAPEQLEGAEASVTTDLYAFTVMSFEVLTGRVPYDGEPISRVLYRIAHEPPEIPESLGPELGAVFGRALAKQPADRHPDLASFLGALAGAAPLAPEARAALERALEPARPLSAERGASDGEPLPEPPLEPTAPARRSADRRIVVLAALAIAVAVGAIVGGELRELRERKVAEALEAEAGLASLPYHVALETVPGGAQILVDDRAAGFTPSTVPLSPGGAHEIRLRKDGYEDWRTTVERGRAVPGPITLKRPPKAASGEKLAKRRVAQPAVPAESQRAAAAEPSLGGRVLEGFRSGLGSIFGGSGSDEGEGEGFHRR